MRFTRVSPNKKGSGALSQRYTPLPPRDCLKDRNTKILYHLCRSFSRGCDEKYGKDCFYMIVRQLKADRYEYLQNQLVTRAQQNPFEASFNVTVKVDKKEYILKIQPDNRHKMVALQALVVDREEQGHLHTLITDNKILSSLLELLIWQGVA